MAPKSLLHPTTLLTSSAMNAVSLPFTNALLNTSRSCALVNVDTITPSPLSPRALSPPAMSHRGASAPFPLAVLPSPSV